MIQVVKKHYTRAKALRAIALIRAKGIKLWSDGYITTGEMTKLSEWSNRATSKIRRS